LTLAFPLDLEEPRFFFLAAVEGVEVCAVPGRPAQDTAGVALVKSAAPMMNCKAFLLIVRIN
jgi:hypothetical protein